MYLSASSLPRRVGDGGEYLAMAINLAAFRPPALSISDLHRVERRFAEIGRGYEVVPLDMPALRGRDGRQDFPHFWLYPLLAVPALWIVNAAGAHPNHAFTIVNLAIACAGFWVLARRASPAVATLVLAGPILWWMDKAHGDVFTVSLLAIAFALIESNPNAALIALGAAAAQNPPLAPVFVIFALVAAGLQTRRRLQTRRLQAGHLQADRLQADRLQAGRRPWSGTLIGLALTLLPIAYYEARLGTPTPILNWTKFHLPSIREAGAFIWDPNIGLLINDPIFIAAAIFAAWLALRRRRFSAETTWMPMLCAAILIAGFAQSININHGATPGVNRWTLWLLPLAIPLLVDAESPGARSRVLAAAAVASVLWSVAWFRPARAEDYKTPTRTAAWVWSQAAWVDNPPIEIFAERSSHAEPAIVPVANPDCRKVLAIDGQWPVPCLPPFNPDPRCTMAGATCYANAGSAGYTFTPVRVPDRLDVKRAARAWPLDDGFARHLRNALDEAGVEGLAPAPSGASGSMLRSAIGVGWTYALQADDRVFVYVADAAAGAMLTLRLPGPMGGEFVDLDSGTRLVGVVRAGEPWALWDVNVPGEKKHVALVMKRE